MEAITTTRACEVCGRDSKDWSVCYYCMESIVDDLNDHYRLGRWWAWKSRLMTALAYFTHPFLKPLQPLLVRLPGTVILDPFDPDLEAAIDAVDRYAFPTMLDTTRLKVVICPWLYKLPWLGYFGAAATRDLVLLAQWSGKALLAHELTHIWQIQQVGQLRMSITYLREGYMNCRYEFEANEVAASLHPQPSKRLYAYGVDITWLPRPRTLTTSVA